MALCIGVRRGDTVRFHGRGDATIESVHGLQGFKLKANGTVFEVDDKSRVEVYKDVFVSMGMSGSVSRVGYTRMTIEAPRSIRVERVRT